MINDPFIFNINYKFIILEYSCLFLSSSSKQSQSMARRCYQCCMLILMSLPGNAEMSLERREREIRRKRKSLLSKIRRHKLNSHPCDFSTLFPLSSKFVVDSRMYNILPTIRKNPKKEKQKRGFSEQSLN